MVTLKNKQRRMRTFNLDAPFFVKRHGETLYGRAETLTLLALERREGLPDAVLSCTEIKAARDAGTLRVYPSSEPASEPEPKPIEPTTESKHESAAEAPKPEPKAEVPNPKPAVESKPKPTARKTSFRRGASEED